MLIWVPSRVRGKKRKMVEMGLEELWEKKKASSIVLSDSWKFYTTGDSWLMMQRGLTYLPEIIDSTTFAFYRLSDHYNVPVERGAYLFMRNENMVKEGLREMYPHAAKLAEKVDVRVKMIRNIGYGKYYFCWPVEVVGLEEVREEVKRLLGESIFSKDDQRDREMVRVWLEKFEIGGPSFQEEIKTKGVTNEEINEDIEHWNSHMRRWGEFFNGAYEIHRKYNAEMWFLVVSQ